MARTVLDRSDAVRALAGVFRKRGFEAGSLSVIQQETGLGRGSLYPIALEGALKLKEISYIHAEGYAAGELKHGPIALIDEETPTVALAPLDDVFEKTASNLQEVSARGGPVIMIAPEAAPAPHGASIRRID